MDRQTQLLVLRSAFDEIAQHLSLRDVHMLGFLDRTLRHHPASHVQLSFGRYLSKYTSNPLVFLEHMRNLGCVISGSAALQFITRDDSWTPHDMDLYCPSHTAKIMCSYLESEGYVHGRGPWFPPDYPGLEHGVSHVVKYVRKVFHNDGSEYTSHIDVVVSRDRSALSPIIHFHSTAVMNFISADRVTSMYPSATFQKLSIQQHGTLSVRKGWFDKYAERGYTHLRTTAHLPQGVSCGSLCPRLKRTTLDHICMHIFLNRGLAHKNNWSEVKWTLVAPPLGTVHCWNPNCANNDGQSIIIALENFMSSAKDCLFTNRKCAAAFLEDGRELAKTLLPAVVGYNSGPGYQLDFCSLELQVSTFVDQIRISMESEWALQRCTLLLKDVILHMQLKKTGSTHGQMGFFNHALHTLDDIEWRTEEFRGRYESVLERFRFDQEFLLQRNIELGTLHAKSSFPLAAMRARDTHGCSLTNTWPSITKFQSDLATSISSLEQLLTTHPNQSSDLQLQTCLKLISDELHTTKCFLNDLTDRQTYLFRKVLKLHANNGLVQEQWDASKRLHLTSLRRERESGFTISLEDIGTEERDVELCAKIEQIGKETVASLKELWITLNPEGGESDMQIWIG